jgi:AAA+ superfamily predicted ATPase
LSNVLSPRASSGSRAGLVLENLSRLDQLLRRAFERAQMVFEREAGGEARPWEFRGLHVSREDAERLLAQKPGTPLVSATQEDPHSYDAFALEPVWGEFGDRLGLTAFDQAVTMLALAPEVDLRYERLYAYLHDDLTRRRPTVSLALDILCPTAQTKVEWRSRFASASPLMAAGLLDLAPDPNRVGSSWLDQTLQLDEQAVAYLLGDPGLGGRLAQFCEVLEPVPISRIELQDVEALASLAAEAYRDSSPLAICFHGPRGIHQRESAKSIASAAGAPIVMADIAAGVATPDSFRPAIAALFRYAALRDAFLFIEGVDALLVEGQAAQLATFQRALAGHSGVLVLNATRPWVGGVGGRGILNVPFTFPDFAARRAAWHVQLRRTGLPADAATVDKLSAGFVLSHDQIAEAAAESVVRLRWIAASHPDQQPGSQSHQSELLSAARAQAGHDLATLARKVELVYRWQDLVVPDEVEKQLREISVRASLRYRVLEEWGFGRKLAQAKGVSVLFTGPSGAGKTMAAEVIASDLMLDLYKIDLSRVVSQYIGVTEKNLEQIFSAAERSNAILFFDEADALFGKRSEVHDAHDRYANIEVSYLLQRMEQYEGIAILATNLRGNLDEAFVRRIAYTVRFSLPGEAERLKIWEKIWPSQDLLEPGVDLPGLAKTFRLSGGNIRNVALSASFFAAARGGRITTDDILRAVQREYEKVGKTMTPAELHDAIAPEATPLELPRA